MRSERIPLVQELRALAVREPVGGQKVLRHIRVEAGAEDAEVAFDGEGQGGGRQGERPDREPRGQLLPGPVDTPPQVGQRHNGEGERGERGGPAIAR